MITREALYEMNVQAVLRILESRAREHEDLAEGAEKSRFSVKSGFYRDIASVYWEAYNVVNKYLGEEVEHDNE